MRRTCSRWRRPTISFTASERCGASLAAFDARLEAARAANAQYELVLRRRYTNVAAGAIRVESERRNDWQIRQSSPFLRVDLAGADALAAELQQAGIETRVRDDEPTLLWEKLAFLAPLALATTALDAPLGDVRGDARYRRAQDEALAVASAEGARIETEALRALAAAAPDSMRSSMQKDVAAGRPPELDAIAGPILKVRRTTRDRGRGNPTTRRHDQGSNKRLNEVAPRSHRHAKRGETRPSARHTNGIATPKPA
jgi:hypothetical protein